MAQNDGGGSASTFDAAAWIAAVSHDLREPMNAVVGMTRLLLETRLDPTQREYAEAVDDAAHGMLTLVNDLLDVSRLERGDLRLHVEPFELARLVRRTVDLARPRGSEPVRVTLHDGTPGWVRGDAGRVRQILVNLVSNACKVSSNAEVALEVMPVATDRLAFIVRDRGPGLPADELERLFQPFEQLRPGAAGGLGLGLAIVRLWVARLGGSIGVESTAGEGAIFRVELPLMAADPAAAARRVSIAGRVVWLVEPRSPLREQLLGALAGQGLDVRALAAEEATALAEGGAEPPDALLVAAAAPNPSIDALAATLGRRSPEMACLALAGSGFRGEAATWREAGFQGYLPRTVSPGVMADALAVLLGAPEHRRPFVTIHSLSERTPPTLRLLVVDDNPLNRRLAGILLEQAGHAVSGVASGEEALALAVDRPFDAVLMDVQMPGMDGLEATRRLRALGSPWGDIPVIAVTANATRADIVACRQAGMDDIVTKPIDARTLLAALADACAVPYRSGEHD